METTLTCNQNVSSLNGQNSQLETSVQESLALVYNALRGENRSAAEIGTERPGERALYFAVFHASLKGENPELAAELLRAVPEIRRALRKAGDPNAMQRAIDKVMNKAIHERRFTRKEYQKVMRLALGKAQLDDRPSELSRAVRASSVAQAVSEVSSNGQATAAEVRQFRATLKKGPQVAYVRIPTNPTPPTPNSGVPSNQQPGTTVPSTELEVPGSQPKAGVNTDPQSFVFKPISDLDGNLLIQVPLMFSGKASEVSIWSAETGEHIADLRYSGNSARDGRAHWRLDQRGDALPQKLIIRLALTDGTEMTYAIEDPSKTNVQGS